MPFKLDRGKIGKLISRRRPSLSGIKKKKHYQVSEAVTLFTKGIRQLARYYPIPKKAIKEFEEAVKRHDVLIEVLPGDYLAKTGRFVTAGEMVYSPAARAWVVKLPSSAFDEFGNMKPDAVLTLWHELTHVVRSFIPQLEKLPTAYDEATTNFIADRLAMLYTSAGIKARYLPLSPEQLERARLQWRRTLAYKPDMVEQLFTKGRLDKLAEEHKMKALETFARGLMLKKKIESIVENETKYLELLKKTNPELYRIHKINLVRKELLKNRVSLERWAKRIPKSHLVDAVAEIEETGVLPYLEKLRLGDEKFKNRKPRLPL